MKVAHKSNGYWTLEKCKENTLLYESKTKWNRGSSGAYGSALKHGWVSECCKHMIPKCKPHGYWTLKRCKEDALLYESRTKWQRSSAGAYDSALKHGWVAECCNHMIPKQKPSGYWTLEKCQKSATKFSSRVDWKKAGQGYHAAKSNGWIDECCGHMTRKRKPIGYWTLEKCKEDALLYESRFEWQSKSNAGYVAAFRNSWVDECCAHMTLQSKPKNYWTLARCQQDATRFMSRKEWQKNSSSGYSAASNNGWVDICCPHMQPIGNKKFRCIYVYFVDKYFYVGLTGNIKTRIRQHFKSERVKKLLGEFGVDSITVKQLTNYISAEEASRLEGVYESLFIGKGLTKLNIKKTGGLGGDTIKYTKEVCKTEALKWSSRSRWSIEGKGYDAALQHGWVDECCKHMIRKQVPNGYWTLEKCKEDALLYKSRTKWAKKSSAGYCAAFKRDWLDECCDHMVSKRKPNGFWTLEKCKEDARLYKTRSEWKIKSASANVIAKRNGWLDECCKHMISNQKPRNYWTLARCKEDALLHRYKTEWKEKGGSGYSTASKNGWMKECCGHMIPKYKANVPSS